MNHSRDTGKVGQDSFSYKEEKQSESRLAVIICLVAIIGLILFGMQ
jgi:hypothetical protein